MSEKLVISGGKPLKGSVHISGAKNSALPILAGTLLTGAQIRIKNLPHLRDVTMTLDLLGQLGGQVSMLDGGTVCIQNISETARTVPYQLVKAMRASILVLGPMLARYHEAKVALPGGCAIGARPIDMHLTGLRAMGAEIEVTEGFISAKVNGCLKAAEINMRMVSVTGTENLMMAAVLAEGETVINNAACEPEVIELADFLNKLGAKITGAGTGTLRIQGVKKLNGGNYTVQADRIEAGTYLVAAATTGGCVEVIGANVECMRSIINKLTEAGAEIEIKEDRIKLDMKGKRPKAVNIETAPFPGFPTDMQAQFMAMNTVSEGVSTVVEHIFENRLMHVSELQRLGSDINVRGNVAICKGVEQLIGAPVKATDLRASASLVVAGLAAQGETEISHIYHMDRGYEYLEEKLMMLGAEIRRVTSA